MAKPILHVYMAQRPVPAMAQGSYTFPPTTRMNYRGVATKQDDPKGFQETMARRGFLVMVVTKRPKNEHQPEKRAGWPQRPHPLPVQQGSSGGPARVYRRLTSSRVVAPVCMLPCLRFSLLRRSI